MPHRVAAGKHRMPVARLLIVANAIGIGGIQEVNA
jgi:hypothetical protein